MIQVNQVDLVFGSRPQEAFDLLDLNLSRSEIQKKTKQIVAVQGVTFQITRGEILVFMGLSGSGKSSLLRCLNGLNGRSCGTLRGEVLFQGVRAPGERTDLQRCSAAVLRDVRRHQISMVFQQFGLLPWQTVLENVAFPLKLQGVSKKERLGISEEKLALVGLKEWTHHYPHELSGGMQQRVGLARAFATNAELLLMDEPFSALDPIHRQLLQDELLQLQKNLRKTMVFVTHDFSEALRIADRIAVMEEGRILQIDLPEKMIEWYKKYYGNAAGTSGFLQSNS